ncbi:TPA: 2-aminoethylphosphonate ABC transporter permease subunit, partial [Burkholderia aenigmatica]|nr:2-aminoethylphosphonate ABC transporter permease subunit [Burkholderia aenigmatica]
MSSLSSPEAGLPPHVLASAAAHAAAARRRKRMGDLHLAALAILLLG